MAGRRCATLAALLATFALQLVATTAGAQDSPEPDLRDDEARGLFEAGRSAFAQGRYEAALERFREAYELSRRPRLLYNIGSAADRLRRDEEALEAFEAYLLAAPNSSMRAQVEARVVVLRDRLHGEAEEETAEGEVTQGVNGDAGPDVTGPGVLPWIVAGSGAALAIGGTILLAVALGDRAELEGLGPEDNQSWVDVEGQHDRVGLFSALGVTGLVVGGLGIAAGLAWALLVGSPSRSAARAEPLGVVRF